MVVHEKILFQTPFDELFLPNARTFANLPKSTILGVGKQFGSKGLDY